MSGEATPAPRARQFLAALLAVHLLALLALVASPGWHHGVHPDADGDGGEHQCGVTLFLSGGAGAPPPAVSLASPPPLTGIVALLPARPAAWVPPVFALGGIFEHGPPSRR